MKKQKFITSLEDIPVFVDVPYICDLLQLHENTVRRLIQNGSIKAAKIGRTWRIPKNEIERIYNEGGDYS
ncbi:MAG: helix-turn-helix domain-containing protein [Ruminococcus sp.]|nr:helix-turn-helix domain-containing protein [Ruminococcus sp.]